MCSSIYTNMRQNHFKTHSYKKRNAFLKIKRHHNYINIHSEIKYQKNEKNPAKK